jgi:hypothetical protein
MEKLHVPTVYLTTSNFLKGAHLAAEDSGVPRLRIVALPSETYYTDGRSKDKAILVATKHFDQIIDGLLRPITPEEADTKPKPFPPREKITATGQTYSLALENLNELFLEKHWSDGLPITPPTPELVKWMLSGTDRDPKEVIGEISPRKGIATVEGIAINSVMAGARPEYLPVILATMDALLDPDFDHQHFLTSTGNFNLAITISGPIVEKIGMRTGIGYMSYGNRANSSIGRAVRMCMINLGQLWPGENDMALMGRADPHTFVVIPENEKDNPWGPYHVSQGFKATDSCVTVDVTYGHTYGLGSFTVYGGGAVAPTTPENIISSVVAELARDKMGGTYKGPGGWQRHLILLTPEIAQEMKSRLGLSREQLVEQLYKQSGTPFEQLSESDVANIRKAIEAGNLPKDREEALKPGGIVPVIYGPEDINVIVVGGFPSYSMTLVGYRRGLMMNNKRLVHMTKLVRLPKGSE